jgi:pimeloyl-ACP methyl ester carboxylesterase
MNRAARFASTVCSTMPTFSDVPGANRPVPSSVPALIIVGGQDPQDPLANVAGVTRVMPNARVVVVRGAGHGAINHGCAERLADRFVQIGTAAGLDTRCAGKAPLEPFVLRLPGA